MIDSFITVSYFIGQLLWRDMQPEAQKWAATEKRLVFRQAVFLSALPTPHPVVLSPGRDLSNSLPIWRLIVFRGDTTSTACKQAREFLHLNCHDVFYTKYTLAILYMALILFNLIIVYSF